MEARPDATLAKAALRMMAAFVCSVMPCGSALAQTSGTMRSGLTVDFEIRPRMELRNGYDRSGIGDHGTATLLTQRNRITAAYWRKRLRVVASLQEIHVWADKGDSPRIGGLNAYELYAESALTENFSLRAGRQALTLDDGRLFSSAPWAQQSRSHEGLRLLYSKGTLSTDLTALLTRPYYQGFGNEYSPVGSHTYLFLAVHHLKYTFPNRLSLTLLSFTDLYEYSSDRIAQKVTTGGRLEYGYGDIHLTISGYYQAGRARDMARLSAYHLQSEVRWTHGNTRVRLGAEVLSGADATLPEGRSHTFNIDYGVAWKFMGNMNMFTRFPEDVGGRGLVNPYIFIQHDLGKGISIRADGHLFRTMYATHTPKTNVAASYLGFENDLSANYSRGSLWDVRFGFSYFIAGDAMSRIGRSEGQGRVPLWSYLMVSFNPEIFSVKRPSS